MAGPVTSPARLHHNSWHAFVCLYASEHGPGKSYCRVCLMECKVTVGICLNDLVAVIQVRSGTSLYWENIF